MTLAQIERVQSRLQPIYDELSAAESALVDGVCAVEDEQPTDAAVAAAVSALDRAEASTRRARRLLAPPAKS